MLHSYISFFFADFRAHGLSDPDNIRKDIGYIVEEFGKIVKDCFLGKKFLQNKQIKKPVQIALVKWKKVNRFKIV